MADDPVVVMKSRPESPVTVWRIKPGRPAAVSAGAAVSQKPGGMRRDEVYSKVSPSHSEGEAVLEVSRPKGGQVVFFDSGKLGNERAGGKNCSSRSRMEWKRHIAVESDKSPLGNTAEESQRDRENGGDGRSEAQRETLFPLNRG